MRHLLNGHVSSPATVLYIYKWFNGIWLRFLWFFVLIHFPNLFTKNCDIVQRMNIILQEKKRSRSTSPHVTRKVFALHCKCIGICAPSHTHICGSFIKLSREIIVRYDICTSTFRCNSFTIISQSAWEWLFQFLNSLHRKYNSFLVLIRVLFYPLSIMDQRKNKKNLTRTEYFESILSDYDFRRWNASCEAFFTFLSTRAKYFAWVCNVHCAYLRFFRYANAFLHSAGMI